MLWDGGWWLLLDGLDRSIRAEGKARIDFSGRCWRRRGRSLQLVVVRLAQVDELHEAAGAGVVVGLDDFWGSCVVGRSKTGDVGVAASALIFGLVVVLQGCFLQFSWCWAAHRLFEVLLRSLSSLRTLRWLVFQLDGLMSKREVLCGPTSKRVKRRNEPDPAMR